MGKICKLIEMTQKEQISLLPTIQHGQMLEIFKILSFISEECRMVLEKARREADQLHTNTSDYLGSDCGRHSYNRGL